MYKYIFLHQVLYRAMTNFFEHGHFSDLVLLSCLMLGWILCSCPVTDPVTGLEMASYIAASEDDLFSSKEKVKQVE